MQSYMAGGHVGFESPEFSTVSECIFRSNMGKWGLLWGPHLQNFEGGLGSYPTIYFLSTSVLVFMKKFMDICFYGISVLKRSK